MKQFPRYTSVFPFSLNLKLFKMEAVVSAVTGDLVSRFISFLMNKFSDHAPSDNKVERLQQLLVRVQTVVNEAGERYITNSGMLIQLKMLAEAMYQGYHLLDKLNHGRSKQSAGQQVSASSSLSFVRPLKRSRTTAATTNEIHAVSHELQSALENLEIVVANMAEFVILLGGCDRMSRKPYDAYLYIDNFMFGRHTEKQQVTNFLLQDNPLRAPTVLPIIGGHIVGKKTLVAHVCSDERVRSSFSSILHLNGDNFLRIDSQKFKFERTLVVVVFLSDVKDDEWAQFYSSVTCMGRGSKVIIVSRLEILVRFGTVKPIHLSSLSEHEFSYLFKTLAFGSANPEDHPQLVSVVTEFVTELGGSLVGAHVVADVLRKTINLQFWLCILEMCRRMVQKNFDLFGEHPKVLFGRGHPVEIVYAAAAAPMQLLCDVPKVEIPRVTLGDLLVDPTIRPNGEFNLVAWESRIPPCTTFVHYVPNCAHENPETSSPGKKRHRLFV